jgi:hypothetical protein
MKKYLLLIPVLFMVLSIDAQTGKSEKISPERRQQISQLNKQYEGTYQIQMIDSRKQPAVPYDLVERVNAARKQNEETFFYLNKNVRIRVLPKSVIERPNFTRVEKIVHLSSQDI